MERFTKGEWIAETELFGGRQTALIYIEGGGFDISGAPDAIANAHLIAASPEMYRFIQEQILLDLHPIEEDRARKLLAKARGEV